MPFTDLQLTPPILKAIAKCGYTTPTPIQAQAIPKALAGHDLIASAPTGTGKTAAFVLPALQRLYVASPGRKRGPRVLVLVPTRELADQVTQATRTYGKYLRVKSAVILGGMPYREQFRALSQPLDMVIATPGRLIDHLERGSINLSSLELLVLDEADRMLDMGFSKEVKKITAAAPAERQTLLFTATLDDTMVKLAQRLLKEPERVQIAGRKVIYEHIEQRLHVADNLQHKKRILQHLIADASLTKAIIFSATKRDADKLARELYAQGHAAAALHGDMKQSARNRTISNMRKGKIRLLVATDVAARGLDVTGISHIINFDLPKFAEDYVHRIGRTGRAGASGIAISFASFNDLNYLDRIERYIGQTLPKHVIPGIEPRRMLRPTPAKKNGGRGQIAGRRNGQNTPMQRHFKQKGNTGSGGHFRGGKWGTAKRERNVIIQYRSSNSGQQAHRTS